MAVNLSVEPFTDRRIKEFTAQAGEVFAEKQTHSQKWSERVQQIDFTKTADELKAILAAKQTEDVAEEGGNTEKVQWPWEDVSQRLRQAMTEVSVLSDVLKVVQHQNYMTLVPVVQEPSKPPVAVKLKGKQKALLCAASVLLGGSEAMEGRVQSGGDKCGSVADLFVSELACLRKRWKVRRIGQAIVGNIGEHFGELQRHVSMQFEIRRVEENHKLTDSKSDDTGSQLQVIIPRDLESQAHLHLYVSQGTDVPNLDGKVCAQSLCSRRQSNSCPLWHHQLQQAQDLLSVRQAYLLLTQEAFSSDSDIHSITNGNVMHIRLFQDLWFTIACLESSTPNVDEQSVRSRGLNRVLSLELILYQHLCRRQSRSRSEPPCPVSVSTHLSETKMALTRSGRSQTGLTGNSLLARVVMVARHVALYRRVLGMLDKLSCIVREPMLGVHCGHVCSALQSVIHVTVGSSRKHEILLNGLSDTVVLLRVLVTGCGVSAVGSDGQTMGATSSMNRLRQFVLHQVCRHLFCVATAVIEQTGWHTLCKSFHTVGDQTTENKASHPGILAASPCRKWIVALRFLSERWPVVKFEFAGQSLEPDQSAQTVRAGKFLTTDFDQAFAEKLIKMLCMQT